MPASKHDCETLIHLEVEEPKMVRVILLNDNYTTQDFVIKILCTIFEKSLQEAEQIMLEVHHNGKGVCGIYPYDIGETKANETRQAAKKASHPLQVFTETL